MTRHLHDLVKCILLGAAMLIASPARSDAAAQAPQKPAPELWAMLGAEQACGLHYNQEAIASYMEKYFEAGDMEVIHYMASSVWAQKGSVESMSGRTLIAHCTQVRRAAKYYGFTQ